MDWVNPGPGGVRLPAGVRAIVFDVGETLVDESRAWTTQAERAGVTPFALMGTLGGLIAQDRDHRGLWAVLGVEQPAEPPSIDQADLYPDALSCLRAARDGGLVVGIAGNQPAGVDAKLHGLGFDADFIASSAAWGSRSPPLTSFPASCSPPASTLAQSCMSGTAWTTTSCPRGQQACGPLSSVVARGDTSTLNARTSASPTCAWNPSPN
jgi:hypothetical protein